eukprot:TRINITY_DN454_c0_g1_i2.p1 TRINITY_DN454_c0_g1~~TRINITY_DN454_c0_g1_i2.p1  ORF type:complete len:1026 (+),score=334.69 TRINITY_DN454_c0_g1_i2:184-3261(+)
MPIDVRDGSHFRELLGSGKLVVADFTASWCGPCMRFAPQFDAMAAKYPEAIWCKVWEHQCRELIMSCGVRSFPTFHFYVSGNKVDEMSGARGQQLEQKVQHWLSVAGPQRLGPVTVKVKFVRERVRESGTGKILVSEEVELEVDPSDGLDVLQFQILSITDIEVDEQLITGGPDDQPVSVLSDADLKKALSLGGGGMYGNYPVLRVKKGRAPPPYVPPPSYGTAQLASAAAWRDCCSAVFFGNEALLQPAWQVREAAGEQKDDAALHLVCHACASRCFGPAAGGKAAAALAPGASSVVPFACETAQACTAGLGVDAFKTRRQGGKELLSHGPVAAKRAMADALEAAGVEAQLQGAGAQGMPSFVSRIDGVLRCVRAYEDPAAQAKAQAVMPVQVLQAARSQGGDEAVCRALLHWFKHDFFQWVNKPACDVCQCSDTESRGTSPPNPHERDAAWASVVEVYRCTRCAATTRFPRVNNPSALLDTRRGRCGEWANCFTLCCRAAGLRARYVLDWTDHVWTEIWLSGQWTHADSCEDKLDSPLMYEHGWGKQLTYTVTVGTEGVLDATPRYTRRWRHVACRRTLVPARGLAQELANINLKIRTALAPHSRAQAEAAEAVETAELQAMCLLTYDTDAERLKSDEAEGRVSGDRAWVASRGEDGGMCAAGNVPLPQGASLLVGRKGYMGHRVTAGLRRLVVQATAHPQAGASLSVGAMTLAAVAKGPAAAAVAAICCSSGTLLFCGAYGTGSGVSSFEQLQSDLAALPKGALIAAAAARGDNTAYLRSALAAAMSSTAVPLSDADNDSSAQPASCRTWVLLGAAMAHVPWARVNCGYSSAPVAAAVELAVPQTAPAAAAAAAAAQSDASALLVDTALALPLLQLPPLDLGSGSSGGTVLSYCPGQPVLIGEVCGSGGAVHAPGWSTTLLPASVGVDGAAACGALPQGGVWRVVEMHDATGSAHDDTIAFSDADAAFPAVGADGGAAAAAVMGGSGGGALLPLPRVVEILGECAMGQSQCGSVAVESFGVC